MVRAWTEAPLVHQGKFYQLSLPELRPRPRQRPHPPIWRASRRPARCRECGRLGAPILMARIPLARVPERLALYELASPRAASTPPRSGVSASRRPSGGSSTSRRASARPRTSWRRRSWRRAGTWCTPARRTTPPTSTSTPRASTRGTIRACPTRTACATRSRRPRSTAPPARVAEQVAELRDAGVHHILCQMSTGYLPHARIMESMRAFGEKVAPRFR